MIETFKKTDNWNIAILNEDKKIKDAIVNLNYTTLKIVIIVNKKIYYVELSLMEISGEAF